MKGFFVFTRSASTDYCHERTHSAQWSFTQKTSPSASILSDLIRPSKQEIRFA